MVRRTAVEAAQTRRDLLDAALEVFGACGYASATLGQIADHAGVTRGALYHHFADKADVYDALLRREADEVAGPLMAALLGDGLPLQRLRDFIVAYCKALARDARFRRAVELLLFGGPGTPAAARARTRRGYQAWLHTFEDLLAQARDRGHLRQGITPQAAARTVVAATIGATTTALHAPEAFSPADDADALADILIAGLTP